MNKKDAREIAETVSLEDLKQMFINAQNSIKDWTQVSNVNLGMSKGVAFNILSKGVNNCATSQEIHVLGKTNMLREFGEYLPNYQKKVKVKKSYPAPTHQEPVFINQ